MYWFKYSCPIDSIISVPVKSPATAYSKSGYWVLEWFPQIIVFLTESTGKDNLPAIWERARLSSRRVKAVKLDLEIEGA